MSSTGSDTVSDNESVEDSDLDNSNSSMALSPSKHENLVPFQQILKRWEEGKTESGANLDPTLILNEMSELLEKECDIYFSKDPDPFEDRHPSRVDPDCSFGQMLKTFFKKDALVQDIFGKYLTDNYFSRAGITKTSFDLNVAACRLVLNIVPGLEASVFMDTEGLVKILFGWAEKAEQPLQSYATGLLAIAMEVNEVVTDSENRERNNHLVPIMIERLRRSKKETEDLFKRPFKFVSGNKRPSADIEELSPVKHKFLKESLNPGWPGHASNGPPFINGDHEWSNSSWAEMESLVIAHFPFYPLNITAQQVFILRYLTPLGEYQEFISYIFEEKILELLMGFVDMRNTNNARLSFEALKCIAALFCHKKFILDFVTSPIGCLQILLSIPRPSIAATAVSQCLYYLGGDDDAMEKVCNLPVPILQKLAKYVLWLVECSHESGRQFGIMFFGMSCSYRVLLEIFDEQDCMRKIYNGINTLPILRVEENAAAVLTDDEEYAQRQKVRQVMVAFKRYVEAHLAIKASQYHRMSRSSVAEVPMTKVSRYSSAQISEFIDVLIEWMPYRSRWPPLDNFMQLGCMNKCLQVVAMAYDWTFPGRAEMVRSALDVLNVCAVLPKAQLQFCEAVELPEDSKPVGINILLSAAEGEIVQDFADVQRAALNVIITCVCSPLSRPVPAAPRFTQGSSTKKKYGGRTCEEVINRVWDCIRTNNGIMALLQLLHTKTPITDADSIRALACKALTGLARSDPAKQIMSKLPIFNNGQLQQLIREPVLQDKRTEHVKFQHCAHELLELVSGPTGPRRLPSQHDFSLEMLHRASVVAQTRITFSREQLLQLIQEYLSNQGLSESASLLLKEAKLPPRAPLIRQVASNRNYLKLASSHSRNHSFLMTPTSATGQPPSPPHSSNTPTTPNLSIRINRTRKLATDGASIANTPSSSMATPNTPLIAKPLQKVFDNFPEESSRITLESIMCDYLSNQHSLCKNPMVTCPQFDLFVPHKCPDPRPKKSAASNFTMRFLNRSSHLPPFGGLDGRKLDRKLVYSKFRPVKVFRDTSDEVTSDDLFYSCAFTPDDQFILCGTYGGEIKMFNLFSGAIEATYKCHESQVTNIEMNREGSLLLTSNAWRTPYSALWSFGDFFEEQITFRDEDWVEFSRTTQDKVIATKNETAVVYDIATGKKIRELKSPISNGYMKNRATFDPSDELVLNDGVLYDLRMGQEIRKLDKLNQTLNGVFHPNGLEIVSNSEVWDIRTFHLLKTVPGLDQCLVKFSNSGDIIYAVGLEKETEDDGEVYDSSFKTFDAHDYSSIATIETKRAVLDLASSKDDLALAVVENAVAHIGVSEESVVRLYDVGRLRAEEEDIDEAENDEENEEEVVMNDDDDDDLDENDFDFISTGSDDSAEIDEEESAESDEEPPRSLNNSGRSENEAQEEAGDGADHEGEVGDDDGEWEDIEEDEI